MPRLLQNERVSSKKLFQTKVNKLTFRPVSWAEHDIIMASQDRIQVIMTSEAIDDLEIRANDSPIARSILIGWLNHLQGIRALNSLEKNAHDEFILEMFSSAIQTCGHFLLLTDTVEYYLSLIVKDALNYGTTVDPEDLSVCAFFVRNFDPDLPASASNPYLAIRMAHEAIEIGRPQQACEVIDYAISKNPKNLDLRFHKARILGTSVQAMQCYSEFTQMAPLNHYWVPRGTSQTTSK